MNTEPGIQLDLLGALRRRGMLIAGVTGLVFLVAYWVAMALPNQYRAYATLLVEPQAVNRMLVQAGAGETDLNDRLHLMSAEILSRPRLSRVIDELGLYQEEAGKMTRQEIIDLMRDQVTVIPVLPELEQALRTRRNIEINTFKIEFLADSPRVAAAVAQRLANDFTNEHINARVEVTGKSLDFIAAEQERLSGVIAELEGRIAAVKAANAGSLPEDMMANQRLLERTIEALRDAQRELDVARSDEAFWANQAAEANIFDAGGGDVSPARRLAQLELALANYRAQGLTDKHPDIMIAKQEIAKLQERIDAEGEDGGTEPANIAQRTAMAQRDRAKQRIRAAQGEIERLKVEVARIQEAIERTPRVAEQLDALFRQHKNLTENLRDFNNRRLEASVQADLERRQLGEQFRVIEPAFPPSQPSSPNRAVILLVGLMVGFSLGVAAAVVAESADSSVHDPQQLQRDVGIPVLASIPKILLPPDIAARRRRWIRNLAAAVAVTLFFLIGGAVTYMVVNGAPGGAEPEEASAPGPTARAAGA